MFRRPQPPAHAVALGRAVARARAQAKPDEQQLIQDTFYGGGEAAPTLGRGFCDASGCGPYGSPARLAQLEASAPLAEAWAALMAARGLELMARYGPQIAAPPDSQARYDAALAQIAADDAAVAAAADDARRVDLSTAVGALPPPSALTMGQMAELRDSCASAGWSLSCGPAGAAVSECRCCAPDGQRCSTVWTAERGVRWRRTGDDALPWVDTYSPVPHAMSTSPDYALHAAMPGMSPLFDLDGQVKWDWLIREKPGLVAKYGQQIAIPPEAGRLAAVVDWLVRAGDVDAATASRIVSGWNAAPTVLPPGSVREIVGATAGLGLDIDSMLAKLYERRPDVLLRDGPQLAAHMSGGRIDAARFDALVSTLDGGLGRALPAGAIGLPPGQATDRGGFVRAWDYRGVEFTIDTMRRLVRDSLVKEQSMAIRRLAERIIAGVYAKDYLSEVAAIYYWVLVNLRYARDPAHIELVQSPLQVLQPTPEDRAAGRSAAQEDCETMASTLAALCMSIGNKAEFVTISTQQGVGYHHVFCVITLPDGQRVVLDPVPGPQVAPMLRSVVQHQAWPIEPVRVPGRSTGYYMPSVSGAPDARWGRHLDVAGLGTEWTVASGPAATYYGPPPFDAAYAP